MIPETSFGLPAAVGSSAEYARADHTHGTPSLPPLGGDLSGPLTDGTVTGLQGRPIATTAPTAGQVLTWSGSHWAPASPSDGSAPSARIVAAGIFQLNGATQGARFGDLAQVAATGGNAAFTFPGYRLPSGSRNLIVKVTPISDGTAVYAANFHSFVNFGFVITLRKLDDTIPSAAEFASIKLMIEVTEITQ